MVIMLTSRPEICATAVLVLGPVFKQNKAWKMIYEAKGISKGILSAFVINKSGFCQIANRR